MKANIEGTRLIGTRGPCRGKPPNANLVIQYDMDSDAWLVAGGSSSGLSALPLRATIGDLFDPGGLLTSPGASILSIRKDKRGEHRFIPHFVDKLRPLSVGQGEVGSV